MSHITSSFFYEGARQLNYDRINHLKTLGLNLSGKSLLETGCGGCGDITEYLVSEGAIVTLNDAREENIMNLMSTKNLSLEYNTWDLNYPMPIVKKFNIIFSYGLLYHLHEPYVALKSFAESCDEFLILSTCTSGRNDENINRLAEPGSNEMAFDGDGCRPGRLFIYNTLKEHFKNVYMLKTQPINEEYPLHFPADIGHAHRNIFIGSHIDMVNPNFIDYLPDHYTN